MTFSLYRGAVLQGMVITKNSVRFSATQSHPFRSVRIWDSGLNSGYEIRNRACVLPFSSIQETHSTYNSTLDSSGVHHLGKLPSAQFGY